MKTTQISYPKPDAVEPPQELPTLSTPPTQSTLPALKLVAGATPEARRIHHLRDGAVVLYRRSRSQVWQVRYKLEDRRWHLSTTGYRELAYALKAAGTIYDRARFKEELGLPQRTAGFGAVAALCLKQLDAEIEQGLRPMTNRDYQRAIRKYLIPHFGKYNLTSIDNNLVREFELWRNQQIGHMPVASTLANHAAAYNRVIDLAVERGWLSANNVVPRLSRRGPKSTARPGFTVAGIEQLLAYMPEWVGAGGHRHTGRQMKLLLRDYVELLIHTGMRCGKESMNMSWQHIEWCREKQQRYLRIWVSGKTGGRWLIAKHGAAEALERLEERGLGMSFEAAIQAQSPKRVFTLDVGSQPYGLAKYMSTGQQRTLYSIRHTYATMELLAGTVIHTLGRQMGTSVTMLERQYSKLTATMAAGQLACGVRFLLKRISQFISL